ncbi:DNA-binding GntR family transcriptional regulator [Plasticicumulans lactativorans]|uniref:DNA-binding GntR family transcriptional regulator n=1 Tax=Plasticicumulans lactativorans TaxID=1133106 RepID=A0A4R2L8L9_9GAMM|nr:GntR family transcriptional regulator [Plasticicumulans lactativorans]TCO80559.1 DNA-binding GntR family transcriptional regulator [Plasticicumulans lactativorans]
MTSQTADQLIAAIKEHIAVERFAPGTRLPERTLAELFRVSRTPIREALRKLADESFVEKVDGGGYVVGSAAGQELMQLPEENPEEAGYLRIAQDRLSGALPERFTENEIMRRYGLTRTQLNNILRRMTQEGWVERLLGHGWAFLPTLTSAEAYDQGYRFRILLEPAAILEPMFKVDKKELLRCRQEQMALLDGHLERVSPAQIFDSNSRLHETIAGFSGNAFILDALRRLNRLRRLMEYQKSVDRAASARRCREHLTLIELLLNDQREEAADFMRLHLRDAAREKSAARQMNHPAPSRPDMPDRR